MFVYKKRKLWHLLTLEAVLYIGIDDNGNAVGLDIIDSVIIQAANSFRIFFIGIIPVMYPGAMNIFDSFI